MAIPNYRIHVDWDNDGMYNLGVGLTDALNLVPEPMWLDFTNRFHIGATGTLSKKAVQSDYGLVAWEATLPSGIAAAFGIAQGLSLGTTDLIPVTGSTTYRWKVRAKGISVFAGHTVTLTVVDEDGNTVATSSALSLTGDWQEISISGTTGAGATFVSFRLTKSATAGSTVVQFTGFQQTAGSTSYPWNAGAVSNRYDDITSWALQATWNGKSDEGTRIPIEGVLEVQLDNTDRLFSPEYASGALFGSFQEGIRVRVQIQRPSTGIYETVWVGWITEFGVIPGGTTGNLQASISASQGMYNLDAVSLQDNLQTNVTFDEVFDPIITGGWYSPSNPYNFILDQSRLDTDGWTPDYADMRTLDVGLTEFPLVGEDWTASETKPSSVLKDLLEIERGWLFLTRDGNFVFRNRDAFLLTTTPDDSLNFNTEANKGSYSYSRDAINTVDVTYYPSAEQTNQVLWTARVPRVVTISKKRVKGRAKFRFEEGSKITVKSINAFGASAPNSTFITTDLNGNTLSNSKVVVEVELENGEAHYRIQSHYSFDIQVAITLRGTIEVPNDPEAVQVQSDDLSIGIRNRKIDNRLVKTEDLATEVAEHYLAFYGLNYGIFESLTIEARDTTWVETMLDLKPKMLIQLTEHQTGITNKLSLIVGEAWEVLPSHARVTYTFSRIDETPYWILGTSQLGVNTYPVY